MVEQRTYHVRATTLLWGLLACALICGSGCGDDTADRDATSADAAADVTEILNDGSPLDAGADAAADGGQEVPLDGFGDISGTCGFLDEAAWSTVGSTLYRNAIDFGVAAFDASALSPGGQYLWTAGNLGGNSLHSEAFSYEVLYRCELAELLKTEGEIGYLDAGGKKTDILVLIDARKVGVSVTRAFHFPAGTPLPFADAYDLLLNKCGDILLSADNAHPSDAWERSMLHVIAYDGDHADIIETAYASLDATLLADTLLVVTVTDGNDDYIY